MSICTLVKTVLCCALLFPVLCTGLMDDDPPHKNGTAIAIHIGSKYSYVGIYKNGQVEILPNEYGNHATPSWVAYTDNGDELVGEVAKNQAAQNPTHTIFDVDRLLGRRFDDPEIQRYMKSHPCKVVNFKGLAVYYVKEKVEEDQLKFTDEVYAGIVRKMVKIAESHLGMRIDDIVLTVPAYFDDRQIDAAIGGAKAVAYVVELVKEPIAAAMAYGLDKTTRSDGGGIKNILVVNLGNAVTFDVSILKLEHGAFEVLKRIGDFHFGGEDFDNRVVDYFVKLFKDKYHKDISKNKQCLERLRRECERVKKALNSSQHEVQVQIESLVDGINFSEPLTLDKFEWLNIDLYMNTYALLDWALTEYTNRKLRIDEYVLIGSLPKVNEFLKNEFNGKEPAACSISRLIDNPDEAVIYGATLQAGVFNAMYGVPLVDDPHDADDDRDYTNFTTSSIG